MYENSKYDLPYLKMCQEQDSCFKSSRKLKIEDLSSSESDFQNIDDNLYSNQEQQQSIQFLMENIEMCSSQVIREQHERKLINILNKKDDQKDNINENKCAEHQDEDLLFVCYNCNMKSLCIECISIGCQHNGHEIKNVKKARADVQLLLNQNLLKLKRKIESIGQEHDKLLLKKSEFIELNQSLKKSIHIQFQEVRDLLNQKEKELLNNLNTIFGNRQKSLNNQSIKIKNKMKIFIESHKVIEETIKSLNDQKLCQYYHKKQKDLQQLVQDPLDYIQTDRILDDLQTFKQQFQNETLKNIIESFTTLQDELNGIRGIETIQTQYMNTITESPEPSKISTTDTPRMSKPNEKKINMNQTQKCEILKDSFFQKIDETVFSVQTNGSNMKDPNNFLFSNIFKKQKESQIFVTPFQKSYDQNSRCNTLNNDDNILSSKVISQFIQETQKSKKMNKENQPQTHRSKSITIMFDEKHKKPSLKDSLCYSQSGIQQSFCQKTMNFQTYESNNILEKSNSSQLQSQLSYKYHQSKSNKNHSMNKNSMIMNKIEEQNRQNQQGQLNRQQSLFSNINARQKTSFL